MNVIKYSTAYALGLVCGIIAVAIAILILRRLIWGKNCKYQEPKYDERQILEQAKAGRTGMYVLIIYNILAGILTVFVEDLPISFFNLSLIGVLFTISVYCCLCIWHEAYFAINQSSRKWITFFLILGVFNFVIGIINDTIINLACGTMCLVISITALIKKKLNDKEV